MVKKIKLFLMRSNIIDLATGVVIGTAFQKIISAMIDKIFMPFVGVLVGGVNLKDRYAEVLTVKIGWGEALQATFDFVVVGTILYFFLKALGQNTEAKPQVDDLLIEIRDELRKLNAKK
ncbi:MAG: large conductance mechanosensitive channel protein MscL [Emticicia sp.]|uniref:Large-conductance mechanosensitive channel n=1 Tax=Emticicia aquatilis TaxID=1537369 RepID=A0A916YUR8_9BACT|nr:large conductance mechanosensitive channel protein MscL [Emticicia aquatilis]GGD61336.1 large-conductance mechanosensitive channel [Emticicia aquatilis]